MSAARALAPGNEKDDARCHGRHRENDAPSGEADMEQRHQAARDQPGPQENTAYLLADLFAVVRDEKQKAGHDPEYGDDDAAFREGDAAEMEQARQNQPDAEKDVRLYLHEEPSLRQ
ncbi:MAG: hypothetical protein ACM3MD_12110 [Betaproteobacteria bacterium]